jgi:hypothetical protein
LRPHDGSSTPLGRLTWKHGSPSARATKISDIKAAAIPYGAITSSGDKHFVTADRAERVEFAVVGVIAVGAK